MRLSHISFSFNIIVHYLLFVRYFYDVVPSPELDPDTAAALSRWYLIFFTFLNLHVIYLSLYSFSFRCILLEAVVRSSSRQRRPTRPSVRSGEFSFIIYMSLFKL